jgi:hypothetical protein
MWWLCHCPTWNTYLYCPLHPLRRWQAPSSPTKTAIRAARFQGPSGCLPELDYLRRRGRERHNLRRPRRIFRLRLHVQTPQSGGHNHSVSHQTSQGTASTLGPRELLLVDAVAERVADLLRGETPAGGPLVDAATLAAELGVSRSFVYEHAKELGAQRLGDGPKARLRFDREVARQAQRSERQPAPERPTPKRRAARRTPRPGSVLAVRPRRPARPTAIDRGLGSRHGAPTM